MRFNGHSRPGAWRLLALAIATVALAPAGALSAPQEAAVPLDRVEIVLDGSAAMRAPIEGQERIEVAREFLTALRGGLAPPGESPDLTLRVYGSGSPRARRDCSDTRLLVEPDAPAARWGEALADLQPRGVSPLAFALEQAAADSVATYVLVTAGGDDCRPDPCAAWRDVIGDGPNRRSRLHVVALAPQGDTLEQLRCLSRAGSGSLTVVDGSGQAGPAGRRLALILRNQGLVDVLATLGPEGERLPLPVRVVRPVPGEVVAAFTARAPRAVPAGVYRVVVESAPPRSFERVMVLPGETATLQLADLGRLRVELLDDQGRRARAPVWIRSADGRRELRYMLTGEDAIMRAGSYDVSVDLGDSVAEREDVAVPAGGTTRVTFGGGGTLLVLAPEFEAPPPTRVLAYRAGTVDTLTVGVASPLPAGRYRLIVQTLPVYVTEDVDIRDESQTVVTLPETGVLGVMLTDATGAVEGVRVDVREPLTGETYGTIRSGERRLAMPGRYELDVRTAPAATITGVDVQPGQERIVRRQGLSRLSVLPPPGAAGPYRLEVLTLAGDRRLGEAVGAQPALPVWPGAYLARVWRGRDLAWEGRVAVASDKTARIDLASP